MGEKYVKRENGEEVLYEKGLVFDIKIGELKESNASIFDSSGTKVAKDFLGNEVARVENPTLKEINFFGPDEYERDMTIKGEKGKLNNRKIGEGGGFSPEKRKLFRPDKISETVSEPYQSSEDLSYSTLESSLHRTSTKPAGLEKKTNKSEEVRGGDVLLIALLIGGLFLGLCYSSFTSRKENIEEIISSGSPAYNKGIRERTPNFRGSLPEYDSNTEKNPDFIGERSETYNLGKERTPNFRGSLPEYDSNTEKNPDFMN